MGAFPALKPGTAGKAPSMVKAVGGPHGEQSDMMREGYAPRFSNILTQRMQSHHMLALLLCAPLVVVEERGEVLECSQGRGLPHA